MFGNVQYIPYICTYKRYINNKLKENKMTIAAQLLEMFNTRPIVMSGTRKLVTFANTGIKFTNAEYSEMLNTAYWMQLPNLYNFISSVNIYDESTGYCFQITKNYIIVAKKGDNGEYFKYKSYEYINMDSLISALQLAVVYYLCNI